MRKILLFFVFFVLALVNAQPETPYTPEVITVSGPIVSSVNFFNSNEAGNFTAVLEHSSPAVSLQTSSIYVDEQEFGSFNLNIGQGEVEKGVYFDSLIISNGGEIVQEIPIIIGIESRSSEIEYDVSIDYDSNSDILIIAGETVISPTVNVYKLNYNNQGANGVALEFSIYSISGELLDYSEEVVSVSTQASFEHFFNLGQNPLNEILIVVSAERNGSIGLDLSQISIPNALLLSPPLEKRDYSFYIYMGIFVFLLSSVLLVSYLWYNRSNEQARDWKSRLDYIKKTQFSDAAKGLRKLKDQKDVLERAYSNHYISKSSFDSAISEISRLSTQLKKRL